MKFLLGTFAVAMMAFVASAEEEAVVTLTTENFEKFLDNNPMSLVEFYAPWCGHCKRLAPEWEKAAKKLQGVVPLGKVDATVERELADKFGVRGYPTIKFFKNRKATEYDGGRTENTIVEWVEKNTGPAVKEVSSEADFKKATSSPAVAFAFTAASKDDAFATFEKLADANRDAGSFVAHIDAAHGDAKVQVFRQNEDTVTASSLSEDALTSFVQEESLPLFGPINGDNYGKYDGRGLPLVWFAMSAADFDKHAADLRPVAQGVRKEYSLVWLDTDSFGSHAENALGVSEYPAVVVQKPGGRYVFQNTPDAAAVKQFLDDVAAGKIAKTTKSEPIPASNDEAVKVVVGNNFEEIVLDANTDVMLEVYAPWCGHCKRLDPIYKEFAESIEHVEHVVIAKMDGTANESPVEGFEWTGFPTIFWVKAGETKPQKYNGARTLEGLTDWIKKHSSKPVELKQKDEL